MNVYPKSIEEKIGFDRIRELIKTSCLSTLGQSRVDDMGLFTNHDALTPELMRVNELLTICREEDNFPLDNYFDLSQALKKIRIEGAFIDLEELVLLKKSLDAIHQLVRFFQKAAGDNK